MYSKINILPLESGPAMDILKRYSETIVDCGDSMVHPSCTFRKILEQRRNGRFKCCATLQSMRFMTSNSSFVPVTLTCSSIDCITQLYNGVYVGCDNCYRALVQRGAKLKVLNYGCGPIVAFEASAVLYAQEIVLAEYAEQNRTVAKLWLDKDPSRPDFSALYRYVVEDLEGRTSGEVEERQEAVRHLTIICSCDIFQDPLIQKGYEGPYDVIYTASCIEDACHTIEVFGAALSKLCDLLNPGGWLLMSVCMGTEAGTYCINYVDSKRYVELKVRETDIYEILQQRCGFKRESITILPLVHLSPEPLADNLDCTMYVIAQKN
ncbi:hypothetical protein EMCRGX_G021839 [Ephydatia muelleri]